MLLDLERCDWDDELLDLFGVDRSLLPEHRPSSERVGEAELLGARLPIAGIAGDQQAALFGQGCFAARPGEGDLRHRQLRARAHRRRSRAAAARAARDGRAPTAYALEGAVLVERRGDPVAPRRARASWPTRPRARRCAASVESTGGVVLRARADRARLTVVGPGCPGPRLGPDARHDAGAPRRARRSRRSRIQVADVVDALPEPPNVLRADGGATANGFLMQFQADLLGCRVEVADERETDRAGRRRARGAYRRACACRPALRAAARPRRGRGAARRVARRVAAGHGPRGGDRVTRIDIHQHLWPEPFIAALARRRRAPRLRG